MGSIAMGEVVRVSATEVDTRSGSGVACRVGKLQPTRVRRRMIEINLKLRIAIPWILIE